MFFVVFSYGCERDVDDSACGVKNPISNIDWLRELRIDIQEDVSISEAQIVLYLKDSNNYFLISKTIDQSHDLPGSVIYDCSGKLLYSCGGNQPVQDSCSIFLSDALKLTELWTK